MSYSLQQTINWSSTYIQYSPLTAGVANEPAITVANIIQNTISSSPFTWAWNRNENSSLVTVQGTQDYTVNLTDFSFLEKVSMLNAAGTYLYEIKEVYNTNILGKSIEQAQPQFIAVKNVIYGTSVSLRFLSVPDQVYTSTLTYQKLLTPFSTLSGNWQIPDQYSDIYNNLFLAEAFQVVDDARGQVYRQRGIAALLSKAEGLTELQRSAFLYQYSTLTAQQLTSQLRTQQGQQARSI